MGIWKRVTEKTKQAVGLKAANSLDWRPTSNQRNQAMIEEARRFSKQLKLLHRELREMEGRIEADLGVLKNVLNSPLPRVYEMSDKGPMPVEKEASIVGSGVSFEVLATTATDLKAKLQQEVLHPLDQWQAAYKMIKVRNGKCEELRLELDAKRREAAAMAASLEKLKLKAEGASDATVKASSTSAAAAGPTGGVVNKFEDAEFKLQKEEDKVARLAQRYRDIEEEVYTALLTLINDTKVLKQYAATALVVFQHAFGQAYTAFGPGGGGGGGSGVELEALPISATTTSGTPAKPLTRQGSSATPSTGNSKGGPDTPEQLAPASATPQPLRAPTWYHDARQNATPIRDDSDDEN